MVLLRRQGWVASFLQGEIMNNGKRILLVEDDHVIQKLITKLCARRGVQVTVADNHNDINQALEKATDFSMFFIDLILPEITGWEVLQKIKSNPALNNKPTIVLTGAILSQHEKDKILKQASAVIEKKSFSLPLFDEILTKILAE